MTKKPFHWEPVPEEIHVISPPPVTPWTWAPPEPNRPGQSDQMCPDMGVCRHNCQTTCFRVTHCEPSSSIFPGDTWPLDPAHQKPVPIAFPPPVALPATLPLSADVSAGGLASVPPPPLSPVPLYVIHTPYPEPPVYTWDIETGQWVAHHPLPIPGLASRRADALNQSERAPRSLDGDDPVWDAGVSVDQHICGVDEANILTSEVTAKPGMHKLALDIDLPAKLMPTTTPGHWHLYIDHEMPWEVYVKVIDALAEAGVIEKGYARASKIRGYTSVRPPWLTKTEDEKHNGGGSG
jgi:hypothetical protein